MAWTLFIIGVTLVVPPAPGAPLQVDRLYHGVGTPLSVTVGPVDDKHVELALVTADGSLLTPAVAVTPGRVDVAALLPAVHELKQNKPRITPHSLRNKLQPHQPKNKSRYTRNKPQLS